MGLEPSASGHARNTDHSLGFAFVLLLLDWDLGLSKSVLIRTGLKTVD
jgi:hypothetical protein